MTEADIVTIEKLLGTELPGAVRQFLLHPEAIPPIVRQDFFDNPRTLVSRNLELRQNGYYHLRWSKDFFAVGHDPGDCVYYFDLGDPGVSVYFADHDHDDPADFKKLAETPRDFTAYLVKLGDDFEEQERRTG
jgi:hypothetical protein